MRGALYGMILRDFVPEKTLVLPGGAQAFMIWKPIQWTFSAMIFCWAMTFFVPEAFVELTLPPCVSFYRANRVVLAFALATMDDAV